MPAVLELSDTNYSSFIQEHYQDEDVIIAKDKMVKRAEVGLLSIDGYIKMIDKALGKGGFFAKFFG